MWQMRANADAAAAATIFVRSADVANKVSKLACSQVCPRMHKGLITLSVVNGAVYGNKLVDVVVRSGTFDVLMEEKMRLMRKANYEESWKRQMQKTTRGRLQRLSGGEALGPSLQMDDESGCSEKGQQEIEAVRMILSVSYNYVTLIMTNYY